MLVLLKGTLAVKTQMRPGGIQTPRHPRAALPSVLRDEPQRLAHAALLVLQRPGISSLFSRNSRSTGKKFDERREARDANEDIETITSSRVPRRATSLPITEDRDPSRTLIFDFLRSSILVQ